MADANTLEILRPFFYKAEQCLDLQPLLGKLFSKGILDYYLLQELESMNGRMKQNRAFLMYLLTQPVKQLKAFCAVLQEDQPGNAAHRELAVEMLDGFPPDPMEADIRPVQEGPLQVYQRDGW